MMHLLCSFCQCGTDALTERLHKPAPHKSIANRVHIRKHALPHNMDMWLKMSSFLIYATTKKPNKKEKRLLLEIVSAIDVQYLQELYSFF